MPFFVIAWGLIFVLWAPALARQNAATYKRLYRMPVLFPRVSVVIFRIVGLVFVLAGVAMLLGFGRRAH